MENKYDFFIAGRARNKENILRICDLFDKYNISYYCFLKNEDEWGYGNENQTPEEKQQEYYSPLKTLKKLAEKTPDSPQKGLTERQIEIVKCIAEGLSNKQIAHKLNLKEGTVKVHITVILKILNVKNRTSAIIEAAKRGYISDKSSENE